MSWRVVLGVSAAWLVAAIVIGGQNALDVAMRGVPATPISVAFIQTLPWIPVTLGAIALAARVPFSRTRWVAPTLVHVVGAIALTYVMNAITVISYMTMSGPFPALGVIVTQGALWTVLRIHLGVLMYAGAAIATYATLYYRRTSARELHVARLEGQLARAHLQTLNAQIRPHFLFNTLHTIGQLWRSGSSDDADAVLDHLGALFHKVQGASDRLEISLAEELEMVTEYLAIEQARFRDRLRTTVNASEDATACLVPPLILQPIVENAIRHGVSAVSTAGRVDVTAERRNGTLELTVRDDGPGFAARSPQPGTGTGLKNTRERLHQLYGAGASLNVTAGADGGSIVCIAIPLNGRVADA